MKTFVIGAPALLFSMAGAAQKLKLDFPNLAAQAKEKAEVNLDGAVLAAFGQKAGDKNAFSGITGAFVRHHEFAAAGAYSDSDLNPLRSQLKRDPNWSPMFNVKESGEGTDFMLRAGGTPSGLLVVSVEPKEVTVVEILGTRGPRPPAGSGQIDHHL